MEFVFLVEGKTEKVVLSEFLKRWIEKRTENKVRIRRSKFEGWADWKKRYKKKAEMYLNGPKQDKIIAVIGLLDLYGPTFYPEDMTSKVDRFKWGKKHFEEEVGNERFKMFFAVHETEAWLLSNPKMFPAKVSKALAGKSRKPENVNFDEPPAKLLHTLYKSKVKRGYRKRMDGCHLFSNLDPELVYEKCPYFKQMMDELLELAKATDL